MFFTKRCKIIENSSKRGSKTSLECSYYIYYIYIIFIIYKYIYYIYIYYILYILLLIYAFSKEAVGEFGYFKAKRAWFYIMGVCCSPRAGSTLHPMDGYITIY